MHIIIQVLNEFARRLLLCNRMSQTFSFADGCYNHGGCSGAPVLKRHDLYRLAEDASMNPLLNTGKALVTKGVATSVRTPWSFFSQLDPKFNVHITVLCMDFINRKFNSTTTF